MTQPTVILHPSQASGTLGPDELRVIEARPGGYVLGALEDHLGSTAMKVRAGGLPHIARYSGFGRDASTLPAA